MTIPGTEPHSTETLTELKQHFAFGDNWKSFAKTSGAEADSTRLLLQSLGQRYWRSISTPCASRPPSCW
jgi:hypothetical protein